VGLHDREGRRPAAGIVRGGPWVCVQCCVLRVHGVSKGGHAVFSRASSVTPFLWCDPVSPPPPSSVSSAIHRSSLSTFLISNRCVPLIRPTALEGVGHSTLRRRTSVGERAPAAAYRIRFRRCRADRRRERSNAGGGVSRLADCGRSCGLPSSAPVARPSPPPSTTRFSRCRPWRAAWAGRPPPSQRFAPIELDAVSLARSRPIRRSSVRHRGAGR
jgi:hypothetical protein